MAKKRVLLVNPKTVNKYYHISRTPIDKLMTRFFRWSYDKAFDIPTHSHCTTMPPISLYALEALMKDRCETLVVDEQVEPVPFGFAADLVCITSTTPQIRRAYQISAAFLERNIPTVIGGVHATCLSGQKGTF